MKWWPWSEPPEPIEELKAESKGSRDSLADVVTELKGYIAELKSVTAELKAVTADQVERGGNGAGAH